jgi:hypothetical protein
MTEYNIDFEADIGTLTGGCEFDVFDKDTTLRTKKATLAEVAAYVSTPMNFKNGFDGGDFTVNPMQRNVAGLASGGVLSSAIANTVTYFADRWFGVGGASSSLLMALVTDTSVPGFNNALKHYRSSGSDVAALYFGQVMETADSYRFQNQTVTVSFWAKKLAGYSGGNVTVQLASGTGSNQSAANLVAGSWTGQANTINSSVALTTTMTRYSFTSAAVVPATATQLGFMMNWTPTGSGSGSTDGIQVNGFQIEIGNVATSFEHRDAQVELEICQRYSWLINEPASGVVVGAGMINGTNAELIYMATPVQFYKAPTVTLTAGSWKFNIAGTSTTAAGLAAGSTHTPNAISVVGTTTATSGQGTLLQGGGGTGYILASADF